MSKWKRLGKILEPGETPPDYPMYTQIPTPVILDNGLIRVFYSSRNSNNQATSFFVDIDPQDNMRKVFQSFVPSLNASASGGNDKDGIAITCVMDSVDGGQRYFTGVNLDELPFFRTQIGMALANGSDRIDHNEKNWCLTTNKSDPDMLMTPFVMKVSDHYHMWYASTQYWIEDAEPSIEYCYVVKHAVSTDGITWKRSKKIAIDFKDASEGGITRPVVARRGEQYEMWYCYRGHYSNITPTDRYYRIGYATSVDLYKWSRKDELHEWINPAKPGDWDYQMQCYPYVLNYQGKQLMFYCGNQYSQAGFGVAERVS